MPAGYLDEFETIIMHMHVRRHDSRVLCSVRFYGYHIFLRIINMLRHLHRSIGRPRNASKGCFVHAHKVSEMCAAVFSKPGEAALKKYSEISP